MELQFKKIGLEDRDVIHRRLMMNATRSCEDSFANLYLWSRVYPIEYAVWEDLVLIRSIGGENWRFPIGPRDKIREALEIMEETARREGHPFRMVLVAKPEYELLEQWFPGKYQVEWDRDIADYVYEREKLASLSGKKYHGKKNHVNKFVRTWPDWTYEPILPDHVEECFQMAMQWRKEEGIDEGMSEGLEEAEEMSAELGVSLNMLRLMEELKLSGGCLKAGGRVVAFTIGEPLCEDTFVVHIEKALTDIDGAYTMINQQFVLHEMENYTYVNREDDTGDEGLRLAKESYHPVMMIEKGTVTLHS